MTDERISLSQLWNETRLPEEAVQRLDRGGWWAIKWLPLPPMPTWQEATVVPEKTTVHKAIYRYERIAGRDWALLAKWDDLDMTWTAIGQFSK